MPEQALHLPTGLTSSMTLNALPETFVDHAEEIWGLAEKDKTQKQIAVDKGWSIDKVKKHSALEKISSTAWDIIVTQVLKFVTTKSKELGTGKVTNGTFSEGLLRDILDLCEYHQTEEPASDEKPVCPLCEIRTRQRNQGDG